jgi:hypothetical protein
MGMHNNISQLVQMNFLSIFLRSSSAILVPGMMEKELQLQKEKQDFLLFRMRPRRVLLFFTTTDKVNNYMITTYSENVNFGSRLSQIKNSPSWI